jgi:hypothetical protein
VRLALKVVMQNDGDFVDIILLQWNLVLLAVAVNSSRTSSGAMPFGAHGLTKYVQI